jgi:hypothetical protein
MTVHHIHETYLGDGVYASWTGYSVKLRTERENGDDVIYLDEDVWVALQTFVNSLKKKDPPNGTV